MWRRTHLLTIPLFGLACAHTVLAEPTGNSLLDGVRAGAVGLAPCLIGWRMHARAADPRPGPAAELERARTCREAAGALLPALNEAQRRTVDALAWLVIPGSGSGPMAGAMRSPM